MRSAARTTTKNLTAKIVGGLIALSAVATSGCLERELKPLNPCLVSGVSVSVDANRIDKVDLLFIVDDSNSMKEEQEALKREFPRLISTLTSGMRSPTDPAPFPPADNVHLAVVSTDLGLVGIEGIPGCAGVGKNGVMQNVCNGSVVGNGATFLSYRVGDGQTPTSLGDQFGCIATLGTGGCGFEQQLEAGLKALWPSVDTDFDTGAVITPNRITQLPGGAFLGTNELETQGQGDQANRGFLRNNQTEGLSLLAIVLVSDEEDCSSGNTRHFTPQTSLDPSDPLYNQHLNLRCFLNKTGQYPVARYIEGFKALRPGRDNLIIFAAIVGVPTDLVDTAALAAVDFDDDAERNAFYDRILNDPRMIEAQDPMRPVDRPNLKASCVGTTATGEAAPAYPPRRIVEVARGFGSNGVVQSICQNDFGPAMDAIIEVIAKNLGAVCLPRPLVRKADGTVGCNVLWELPLVPIDGTPTDCSQLPFLSVPTGGIAAKTKKGNTVCTVAQLPVMNDDRGAPAPVGDGWFYDNFTDGMNGVFTECSINEPQRITFAGNADPPNGIVVKLECLNETQTVPNTNPDLVDPVSAPSIGTPCSGKVDAAGAPIPPDQVCWQRLRTGEVDTSMFCHPAFNVCVRSCTSPSDCPSAWECDDRPETVTGTANADRPDGLPYCVNPTCGTE